MGIVTEDVALLGYGSDLIHGTLVRHDDNETRHGMIVLGDAFGISDHFRGIAQRFARAGYTALGLDLFSRTGPPEAGATPEDLARVADFIERLPDPQVLGDIQSAAAWLRRRRDGSGSVGCAGFCLGGMYTQMAMSVSDGPDVGVSMYGRLRYRALSVTKPVHPVDRASKIRGPLMALFGAKDVMIPRAHTEALRRALSHSKQPSRVHVYSDAGHAFFDDTRPSHFHPQAAADAWKRTTNWFKQHLGSAQRDEPLVARRG
jgi:carboxymethylenebutenolidase